MALTSADGVAFVLTLPTQNSRRLLGFSLQSDVQTAYYVQFYSPAGAASSSASTAVNNLNSAVSTGIFTCCLRPLDVCQVLNYFYFYICSLTDSIIYFKFRRLCPILSFYFFVLRSLNLALKFYLAFYCYQK